MYVILQSSTCFEHQHAHLQEDKFYYHSIWYRHCLYSTVQYSMPDESRNCALKLVNEISLYYDTRSKKHQNMFYNGQE